MLEARISANAHFTSLVILIKNKLCLFVFRSFCHLNSGIEIFYFIFVHSLSQEAVRKRKRQYFPPPLGKAKALFFGVCGVLVFSVLLVPQKIPSHILRSCRGKKPEQAVCMGVPESTEGQEAAGTNNPEKKTTGNS